MSLLKISPAGVRGIVGEGMTAEIALRFSQAFCTYIQGGTMVVSRDSRPSGPLLRSAVLAGALASGAEVIDLGIVPTPSARVSLRELGADGGVVVAAGHNPGEWNALKFLRSDGMYLNPVQGEELLEILHHGEFSKATWDQFHPLIENQSSGSLHIHKKRILETFDVEAIRARRFKVVVDCCNGPCARIVPELLGELNCQVVSLNTDLERPFPRFPNPTPDNMGQLEQRVRSSGADLGCAYGVEGERLGIVTEAGKALHQERVLGLAFLGAVSTGHAKGPIVINFSTSRLMDVLAARFGIPVFRTPTGQGSVGETVLRLGGDFGGEGSGQVLLPSLHPGPDAIAATVLLLQYLAGSTRTLSEVVSDVPSFVMLKKNTAMPPREVFARLREFRLWARKPSPGFTVSFTDGVKLEGPTSWVQVRSASTESMIRIITEAESPEEARELHQQIQERVLS